MSGVSKACTHCKEDLPLARFYKHPSGLYGRLHICKECHKRAVRTNRAKKVEQYREYEAERSQRPERKAKALEYQRKMRALHPEKDSARLKVVRAVKSGRLVPECCRGCGHDFVQGHHPDYSKPLEVIWLCFACHRKEHGQTGAVNSKKTTGFKVKRAR